MAPRPRGGQATSRSLKVDLHHSCRWLCAVESLLFLCDETNRSPPAVVAMPDTPSPSSDGVEALRDARVSACLAVEYSSLGLGHRAVRHSPTASPLAAIRSLSNTPCARLASEDRLLARSSGFGLASHLLRLSLRRVSSARKAPPAVHRLQLHHRLSTLSPPAPRWVRCSSRRSAHRGSTNDGDVPRPPHDGGTIAISSMCLRAGNASRGLGRAVLDAGCHRRRCPSSSGR